VPLNTAPAVSNAIAELRQNVFVIGPYRFVLDDDIQVVLWSLAESPARSHMGENRQCEGEGMARAA
jgi:hypothetical protein